MDDIQEVVVQAYLAPNLKWSGTVFVNGVEVGRISGCDDPDEVKETAEDLYPDIDRFDVKYS